MDGDEDGVPAVQWKEPVNGKTAFFTEEVYRQFMGPEPSVEDTVNRLLDELGYPAAVPHSAIVSAVHVEDQNSSHSGSREDSRDGSKVAELEESGACDTCQPVDNEPLTVEHEPAVFSQESDPAARFTGRGAGQSQFAGKPGQEAGFRGRGRGRGRGTGRGRNFRPATEGRRSSLNHEQQIRYLDLFKKCTQRFFGGFCQPPNERELKEIMEFEKLQLLVAKEQEEFQVHLRKMAQTNPSLYKSLPPHAMKYFAEKQESSCKRAKLYARHYSSHGQLPMAIIPADASPVEFKFIYTLLEVGAKCKVVIPEHRDNTRFLQLNLDQLTACFPPWSAAKQDGSSWNHEMVSQDSNIETLVSKHKCQVVTTANVLSVLLSNYPPVWDIPITVRQCEDSASGKVVFLDKPLYPQGLTPAEKKTLFLQKLLRTNLCHPPQQGKKTLQKGPLTSQHSPPADANTQQKSAASARLSFGSDGSGGDDDDDDPFGASYTMDDLETFGSDKHSVSAVKMAQTVKTEESAEPDVDKGKGASVEPDELGALKAPSSSTSTLAVDGIEDQDSPTKGISGQLDSVTVKVENDAEKMSCDEATVDKTSAENDASVGQMLTEQTETMPTNTTSEVSTTETAQTTDSSATEKSAKQLRHKRHLRSAFKSDEDQSDSDEGTLCIDVDDINEPLSPQKRGGNAGASSESRTDTTGASNHGEFSARRMTRSASQRLKSVEDGSTDLCSARVPSTQVSGGHSGAKGAKKTGVSGDQDTNASPEGLNQQPELKSIGEDDCSPTSPKKSKTEDAETSAKEKGVERIEEKGTNITAKAGSSCKTSQTTKKKLSTSVEGSSAPGKSSESTPLDSILEMQEKMLPPGGTSKNKMQENAEDYQQPGRPGESVSYNLWDFAGVPVLLRCCNHGFVRNFRQEQQPVYLMAKPERQMPNGLEQTTLSEAVRAWVGCYFRPNSHLVRVRVDAGNDEIVHVENMQLNQILQPTLNFSVQGAFLMVKNIFSKLTELPAGSYLLSHELNADHFQLRAATENKRSGYDLHFHHMGFSMVERKDKTLPWVPLDPTLILPHHWRLGLIPATFQPPDFDPNRTKQTREMHTKRPYFNKKKKQRGRGMKK